MTKDQKNESIFESLSFLKNDLISLKEKENSKEIDKYLNTIENLTISFKGLRRLTIIIFVALIISIGFSVFSVLYKVKVTEFNKEIKDHRNDSVVRKILDIKEITKGDSITTSYNYLTRKNKIVTYNQLNIENDSLQKTIDLLNSQIKNKESKIENLENKLNSAEDKLKLATDYYGIRFIEQKNSIEIVGKKIDSGLILLQAYRNKMQYDNKTKSWSISK